MNRERRCGIYLQWNITQLKKNEILPFAATWMDLEMIVLSEASQTEKEPLHGIAYMWNLNNNTKELV